MTGDPGRDGNCDATPDDAGAAFEARLRHLFAEQPAPSGPRPFRHPGPLPAARPHAGRDAATGRGRRLVPALSLAAVVLLLVTGGVLLRSRTPDRPAVPVTEVTPSPDGAPPRPTPPGTPTRRPSASPPGSPSGTPSGTAGRPRVAPVARRPSGPVTASTPGQVVEGLDITGSVTVTAPGVVVRDCRVRAGAGFGVRVVSGSLTITDTEITGSTEAGLAGSNWRALRVHVHDTGGDAVELGSHVLLADSRIDRLTAGAGVRATGGLTDVTLRGDTIDGGSGLAALFLAPDLGPDGAGPVVVQDNVLGGGTYTVYLVDGGDGRYHQRGYRVDRNRFRRGARAGPVDVTEPASSFDSWTGNVWADTAAVVDR